MALSYKTISKPSTGLYKDKGSKFLAFAEPVSSIDEVKQRLDYYRKQYYDARHCCYAYVLGQGNEGGTTGSAYRANDDGEPSGTAGRPILGQINNRQLTDIMVVVVRYFGGILLGTSGLIVAYKEAANDALYNAEIITKDVLYKQTLVFDFAQTDTIMKQIRKIGARIIRQSYTENGQCELYIKTKELI